MVSGYTDRPTLGPMNVYNSYHSRQLCESLCLLRQHAGLLDLEIECDQCSVRAHKVVMAACSKFFKVRES